MTSLLSVRAAGRWCSGAREGRVVKSSGIPEADSGAEGAAACPEAAVEATEVSPTDF